MNYLEVYFSRMNHLGETATEVALNSNIRSFERWLAGSPFTVENLSVERGLYFSGIIQTSKDKEEKKLMYLYVANDIPIQVGDILTWTQDNGTIEKWILLQKIHDVHEAYQTFQMIKCNYELKWIDEDGYLHKSWAYVLSSKDEMVKGNFRMWHSLVTPQPNKYAEIIMPRPELNSDLARDQLLRGINFIIQNEAWTVIECDWTSVDGIIYMSLTESKINYQYDDRDNSIADTDRLTFPSLQSVYKVGDYIIPEFTGETWNEWQVELIPTDESLVQLDGERWRAVAAGKLKFTMRLKDRKAVTKEYEIEIYDENAEFTAYIDGPSEIKLDRYCNYSLTGSTTIIGEVEYSLEETQLASISNIENNICTIHANKKNKLGEIILNAQYNGVTYTKTIKIVPLW